MQFWGHLCAVNSALQSLSYTPKVDFNTQYIPSNASWSPEWAKEAIFVFAEQPAANRSNGQPQPCQNIPCPGQTVGPNVTLEIPVSVKPVDTAPSVSFILPGKKGTNTARTSPTNLDRRRSSTQGSDDSTLFSPFRLDLLSHMSDVFFCGGPVACDCPASALAWYEPKDLSPTKVQSLGIPIRILTSGHYHVDLSILLVWKPNRPAPIPSLLSIPPPCSFCVFPSLSPQQENTACR